jgi:hypothetical protein
MAQGEKYGKRDLSYNIWHRKESIKRFVPENEAQRMYYNDIDGIEFSFVPAKNDRSILHAIIEVKNYAGKAIAERSRRKCKPLLCELGRKLNIPAYLVFYFKSNKPVPGGEKVPDARDISKVWVHRIWPDEEEPKEYTPEEWAKELLRIRKCCRNGICENL